MMKNEFTARTYTRTSRRLHSKRASRSVSKTPWTFQRVDLLREAKSEGGFHQLSYIRIGVFGFGFHGGQVRMPFTVEKDRHVPRRRERGAAGGARTTDGIAARVAIEWESNDGGKRSSMA